MTSDSLKVMINIWLSYFEL